MYKGDILPAKAYKRLVENENAVLIDVRTQAEWGFVGIPAIAGLVRVAWQEYPAMDHNTNFIDDVAGAGVTKDHEILLICRSGQRSASAAGALTAAGYTECYNVAQGFEGDKDGEGHRGNLGGWKHAGLPWVQS